MEQEQIEPENDYGELSYGQDVHTTFIRDSNGNVVGEKQRLITICKTTGKLLCTLQQEILYED